MSRCTPLSSSSHESPPIVNTKHDNKSPDAMPESVATRTPGSRKVRAEMIRWNSGDEDTASFSNTLDERGTSTVYPACLSGEWSGIRYQTTKTSSADRRDDQFHKLLRTSAPHNQQFAILLPMIQTV
jgi:hypothetical protein